MTEPTPFKYSEIKNQIDELTELTEREAFIATRRAFTELEAMGASYFNIFNALACLFGERGNSEIAEALTEVAYKFYQQDEI
jgi:hypothetical protein